MPETNLIRYQNYLYRKNIRIKCSYIIPKWNNKRHMADIKLLGAS